MNKEKLIFVVLLAVLELRQVTAQSEQEILCEGLKSGGFCDVDAAYMAETCGDLFCQNALDDPNVIIEQDIAGLTHEQLRQRVEEDNKVLASEAKILENAGSGLSFKSALSDARYHWPKGRVPYTISSDYSSAQRRKIRKAMDEMEAKTCIRFVDKTSSDRSYLSIESRSGCYSYLGRVGQGQVVSLNRYSCLINGIIQHELLHALSFIHEQSRPDRDSHIDILWDNIQSNYHTQFQKYDYKRINLLGAYDYGSVMHYGPTAFSKNGRATIRVKNGVSIGQRRGLSNSDVKKVNKLYCDGQEVTTGTGTTQAPNPGPTAPKPTSCRDEIRYCYIWKWYGMCNAKETALRNIMKQACAKTCNLCSGSGSGSGKSGEKPGTVIEGGGLGAKSLTD